MMRNSWIQHCVGLVVVVLLLTAIQTTSAQDRRERFREMRRAMEAGIVPPGAAPGTPQPTPPATPKEGEKKDEKPAEAPKDTGPKPVTRPNAPSTAPKLDEQKLKVDDKKMVAFNFEGAPWNFVLDELARVSEMNLDFQELPGDFLNLRNPRPYTLDEARDTINQHLLARGYTMLNNGVTLSVVNLDKINPAAVPRVSVEELDKRQPHEFVKVSFSLQWMLAETAVDEFKPMLSPKGKLTPLKSTNRVEAVDAVINLREIRDLLSQEEGPGGQKLVTEIELKHTRAIDIKEQLEIFLGLKKESPFANLPKDPQGQQMAMQMMQMQAQMRQQQQQQQQQAGAKADPNKSKEDVHLSTNPRRNSILVQAPPDQLVIIRQTIEYLDVQSERPSLLANSNLMQTYRLATVDPAILISTLESVGDLSPDTKLELDKTNRAIIAYAAPVDQFKIRAVVQQLDGTDRKLHVVRLRRLEADQVAGTIERLLVGEKQDTSNSRRSYYGYYGFGGGGGDSEQKKTGEFRIDADITQNRLLLWANDIEYEEVMKFLAELGEIPPKGGNPETIRVLDVESEDDLLEQIRRAWPSLGPNQLNIQVPKNQPAEKKKEKQKEGTEEKGTGPDSKPAEPRIKNDSTTTSLDGKLLHFATFEQNSVSTTEKPESRELAQNDSDAGNSAAEEPQKPAPAADGKSKSEELPRQPEQKQNAQPVPVEGENAEPPRREEREAPPATRPAITITRDRDGRLLITSDDTEALDRMESLITRLAPPRKDYKVFTLKNASALWVKYNLEDFFKEEDKDKNTRRPYWYYWEYGSDEKKDTSLRLSKRRPLKFIDDTDSNTILVQGADSEQLKTIEELINMYDQPTQNSKMVRMTRIFQIQHSKAKVIAEAVKDVYRDLLSANDKALQQHNETKNKGRGESYYFNYGEEKSDEINQGRFKGLLSIGIDEASNNLVVSAPASLLNNVATIIEDLDRAAEPQATTFQVLQINRSSNADEIQKKLAEMLGNGAKGQAPQQQPQQPKVRKPNGREARNEND